MVFELTIGNRERATESDVIWLLPRKRHARGTLTILARGVRENYRNLTLNLNFAAIFEFVLKVANFSRPFTAPITTILAALWRAG